MSTNKKYTPNDFLKVSTIIPEDTQRFDKKINEVDIVNAYNRANKNIVKAQKELQEAQIEIKNHQATIDKQQQDIKRHDDLLKSTKNFLWVVFLVLVVTIITWFVETFWKFNEVKQDYVIKTEELKSQIQLYDKKINTLEEKQKEISQQLENDISKEVELQLLRQKFSIQTK